MTYAPYTKEQEAKVKRIVALAEDMHPDAEYGDMAYDAVVQDANCDEKAVAHRIAMAHAFP